MNIKKVDRVYCDNIKDYQELKKTPFLAKEENATIFILAMALGFKRNQKVPLKKRKEGIVLLTYFKESQIAMIYAVALKHKESENVLLNEEEIFQIAEEYANGGIKFLKDILIGEQPGSYVKRICTELLEICNKLKDK